MWAGASSRIAVCHKCAENVPTASGEAEMNIHEYQAKELLRGYGVAVLQGFVAWTP